MDGTEVLLVAVGALATSTLTAVLGFGGGIVLLALLLLVVDPVVAIPLHAAIQVASNGTRTVIRRHDVDWGIVGRSSLLLLPAGALTVPLARAAPEAVLQVAIAVTVLVATWVPERTALEVPAPSPAGWVGVGAVAGALNPLVGATGPLFAPLFKAASTTRQRFVGTFAGTQVAGHGAKLVLFGAAGLAPTGHLPTVAAGIGGVVVGTELGSRVLDRMSEQRFRSLYLAAISAVAVYLVVDGVVGAG
jgi:uncharacterized membrane protein YfcA